MNITHLYFSPNRESEQIAKYFNRQLGGALFDLTDEATRSNFDIQKRYELIILTLPVYAQQIPIPLRPIVKKLKAKYVLINLTYGGFSYGNVLYDCYQKLKNAYLLGYSITPVKHAYIDEAVEIDLNQYDVLINRIQNQTFVDLKIKYRFKNIFARFFESIRTHYNFKLSFDKNKCHHCHICIDLCPVKAINDDFSIDLKRCIACGRCSKVCSKQAFQVHYSKALCWYLKGKRKTEVIVK